MSSREELSFAYVEAHPVDAARVLERVGPLEAAALLETAPVRLTAPVLKAMLPLHAARCLEALDDAVTAGLLKGVGPQASVAVLRYLPESRRLGVLAQLPRAMSAAVSLVLGYSRDTVGAWMEPGSLAFPADLSAGNALDRLRRSDQPLAPVLYALDHEQRLRGVVDLGELLRADADTELAHIMRPSHYTLSAGSLLRGAHDHPGWSEHCVLPVVERGDRFMGVLRHSVLRRAVTRAERTFARPGGALAEVAGTYWLGVSTLIEVAVGFLPVQLVSGSDARGDDQKP